MNRKSDGKIKEAAALKYEPGEDAAPKIVAAGKGEAAQSILNKAKESDVPVHKDKNLAHILSSMGIGEQIPQELYEVVAEILVFISKMDTDYDAEV